MSGDSIDLKSATPPVPFALRGLVWISMVGPLFIFSISKLVSIPFALVGLALLTIRNGIRVDLKSKTYQEYTWFLGIRFGKMESFNRIEYVFLKSNKVSQKMSARLASTTVHSEVYDGFIRFSETDKVHVFRGKTKESVMQKLQDLSAKLQVDILDYSQA